MFGIHFRNSTSSFKEQGCWYRRPSENNIFLLKSSSQHHVLSLYLYERILGIIHCICLLNTLGMPAGKCRKNVKEMYLAILAIYTSGQSLLSHVVCWHLWLVNKYLLDRMRTQNIMLSWESIAHLVYFLLA